MEIVTEPDIRTAEQARRYAEELQLLMRSIGASDADMERGQMRVEANVSLRPRGTEAFGTRVEVKNMNSFRAVERAIAFEIERQAAALDAGEPLVQETRGWSEERGATYRMRVKETSDDYRYFPEPDLPPLHLDAAWLAAIGAALPELPAARRARYRDEPGADAPTTPRCSSPTRDATELFEATRAGRPVARCRSRSRTGSPASTSRLRRRRGGAGAGAIAAGARAPSSTPSGAVHLARAASRGARGARRDRCATAAVIAERGYRQITDKVRSQRSVDEVLAANPAAVADYRAGKAQAVGYLVGQVMKATRGQANAALVQETVGARLAASAERRIDSVGMVNFVLWVAGVALIAVGYQRARGPYARYQALKAQDANVARYESWRGGAARQRQRPARRSPWRSFAARPRSAPPSRSPVSCSCSSGFLIR